MHFAEEKEYSCHREDLPNPLPFFWVSRYSPCLPFFLLVFFLYLNFFVTILQVPNRELTVR